MKIKSFLRGASLAAILAVTSLAADSAAYAASQPVLLPTGAWITPDAAPGSVFQPLTVALPDYPNFEPDSAQTTAVSPDGKTLLILTSGFNLNLDANGHYQPQDSSEFVFVYDISSPSVPVQKQVVLVPDAFSGLVWSPDGSKFYVAGGVDDNLHTYAQSNGQWVEVGTPISLGHKGDLMNLETEVGPTAGGVGITADGSTVIVANYETDSITDRRCRSWSCAHRIRSASRPNQSGAVWRSGRRIPVRRRGGRQHGLCLQYPRSGNRCAESQRRRADADQAHPGQRQSDEDDSEQGPEPALRGGSQCRCARDRSTPVPMRWCARLTSALRRAS